MTAARADDRGGDGVAVPLDPDWPGLDGDQRGYRVDRDVLTDVARALDRLGDAWTAPLRILPGVSVDPMAQRPPGGEELSVALGHTYTGRALGRAMDCTTGLVGVLRAQLVSELRVTAQAIRRTLERYDDAEQSSATRAGGIDADLDEVPPGPGPNVGPDGRYR